MKLRDGLMAVFERRVKRMQEWARENVLGLFIFNVVLLVVVLLRSVGYFSPFLPLGVNTVFLLMLTLSIVLFGGGSRYLFLVGLAFWILAGFFKMVGVGVWAERAAIYAFEALVLGVMILAWEVWRTKGKVRER